MMMYRQRLRKNQLTVMVHCHSRRAVLVLGMVVRQPRAMKTHPLP